MKSWYKHLFYTLLCTEQKPKQNNVTNPLIVLYFSERINQFIYLWSQSQDTQGWEPPEEEHDWVKKDCMTPGKPEDWPWCFPQNIFMHFILDTHE